jgi:hypothetical protein
MDDTFFCGGCREFRPRAGQRAVTLKAGEVIRCATCASPMSADEGIDLHEQLANMTEADLNAAFRNP